MSERFLDSSTPHREAFTHLRNQIVSSHDLDQRAWSSQLGGRVALEVAVTNPERVTSLILLCPALRGAGRTADAESFAEEEGLLLTRGEVDAAVELNVSTWLGPDASAECRDLVREMQRHAFKVQLAAEKQDPAPQLIPAEVVLSRVSVPTIVVSGGRDMDHFQDVAQRLASSIDGAHLERLPWAAHLPSLERPEEVNELVRDFLATTTAG